MGFDVWVVVDRTSLESPFMLQHPGDQKLMDATRGIRVAKLYGFQNDERETQFAGPDARVLKSEIPIQPASGSHPIEDVLPLRADRCGV
jgi:hypothetical protein